MLRLEISISRHVIVIKGKVACCFSPSGKIRKEEQLYLCSRRSTSSWKPCLSSDLFLFFSLSLSAVLNNGSTQLIEWIAFGVEQYRPTTAWARIAEYLPGLICGGTVITLVVSSCRAFYFAHRMRFFIVVKSIEVTFALLQLHFRNVDSFSSCNPVSRIYQKKYAV